MSAGLRRLFDWLVVRFDIDVESLAEPDSDFLRLWAYFHFDAITTVLLCSIESNVGASQEVWDFLARLPLGDADTGSDLHLRRWNTDRLLTYMYPHAFGDFASSFGCAVGQHNKEFFAAASANMIIFANCLRDSFRCATEHVISNQMAVPVVDEFEEIQVDKENAERCL